MSSFHLESVAHIWPFDGPLLMWSTGAGGVSDWCHRSAGRAAWEVAWERMISDIPINGFSGGQLLETKRWRKVKTIQLRGHMERTSISTA